MMEGKRFTRTNNAYSTSFYLQNILNDFGPLKLQNAISAVEQHIEYYESLQKVRMHKVRDVLEKYSNQPLSSQLVSSLDQILENIETVENYLVRGSTLERHEISNIIKNGVCFIAYQVNNEMRFAPSKFLGYQKNSISNHVPSSRDGRDTNASITKILKHRAKPNLPYENEFLEYTRILGVGETKQVKRKYWFLQIAIDFRFNQEVVGEFPEGKVIERMHKSRERDPKVIEQAKHNFKQVHGRLFCEACGFDFAKQYGETDFIEGHHSIAISDMKPGYMTRPEEIIMLCSNCHSIVHRRRPWLSIEELQKLLVR